MLIASHPNSIFKSSMTTIENNININIEDEFISFSSFSSAYEICSQSITVPPESFYLAPYTHFVTKMNVGELKERVEVELNRQSGVSFKFFPSKCRWEGTYSDESSYYCKFEVNVFERSSGELVVEGNRLSGDSFAFIRIYKNIKNIMNFDGPF